ncbi:hypothetical protein Lgra_3158 [Legionella gratiana]|uniref:Uncharacterized protein n=1 Tax=Legionella gratiana TaxID=45066 RepID=A0A378JCM2_9GAMM|nr:hypothetical protein [Legionella gratiana]KTD06381.1 hypothetical protein Lgra_3158 [Legionella gratiana]STX45199.1 Uncharacterised protein [Legionella gratiana]
MYRLVNFVLFGLPMFLLIDSPWAAQYINHGQDICNLLSIVTYSLFLLFTRGKLYWLILLMTLCGLCGEIFGSLILALYEYRLKNIPVYIPLCHALLYAAVYYTSKRPCMIRNKAMVKYSLAQFAFLAAFLSLLMLKDVAGFLGYLAFLAVLRFRKNTLFYLLMFAIVYYLELMGTVFYTWSWYGVTGAHPHFPSIGFTPSGAAILYVLVDLMINSLYFYFLKILRFVYRIVPELRIKELRTQEN